MYSSKREVHALVSLMSQYGISEVVSCPGSRNAVIINDMYESGFHLHPVTDERSAGFVALGLALATCRPVAVCVTSGSALLNVLPAVSEAYYRNIALLVISADRPARFIDTWDGQTIPQLNALQPYATTISVEESENDKTYKWNELKINQALSNLCGNRPGPVHLNIAIEEPLFDFTTESIVPAQKVSTHRPQFHSPIPAEVISQIETASLPVLFVGQNERDASTPYQALEKNDALLVLPELLSSSSNWHRTTLLEQVVDCSEFHPDLIIHIGGNLVNKHLKNYFRQYRDLRVIRIEEKDFYPDTLHHLDAVIYADVDSVLKQLSTLTRPNDNVKHWKSRLSLRSLQHTVPTLPFSDLYVMQQVAERIQSGWVLQLANSTTVRNATLISDFAGLPIYANRGTNGIEGSLSTAVGYALGTDDKVLAMTGDLSFFYDANALYNTELPANLSLIVFNNGGGQIFRRLPGLHDSQALDKFISASHSFSAKGIAETYNVKYFTCTNEDYLANCLNEFLSCNGSYPALLEVFTSTENNEQARKAVEKHIKNNYENNI